MCIVLARVTNWLANARVSPLSLAPAACRTKTQAAHRESHHLGFVYATPVTHSHTHTKSFLQSPLWLEDHCRLPEGAHLRNVTIGDRGRSFALIAVLAPGVPLSEPQPRERRPISHSSLLAEGCAIRMGVLAQRFIYLLADGYRAKTRAPIPQRNPYPMANVRLYGQNSS